MKLKRAIFHLGLHKTGTTSIQNHFETQVAKLASAGVRYVTLGEARREISALLIRPYEPAQSKALDFFEDIEQPTLLLSDENIIGGVTDPLQGAMYTAAERRLRSLASLLSAVETHIVIIVRAPRTFLPAMYTEYLRHGRYVTFGEYISRLDLDTFSFANLFGWVENAGLAVHWHFLPFEQDLGGGVETIFNTISALALADSGSSIAPLPAQKVRSSPTREEMDLIEEALRREGPEFASAVARLLGSREIRLGTQPYRPIEEETAKRLDARYRDDVSKLLGYR